MDERTKTETYIRKMNTFAIGSLPVHFSVAKLFTFRWQYTVEFYDAEKDEVITFITNNFELGRL